MAVVIDQVDRLAAVLQAVANAPVVGIDGDGEPRGLATAKEDEV